MNAVDGNAVAGQREVDRALPNQDPGREDNVVDEGELAPEQQEIGQNEQEDEDAPRHPCPLSPVRACLLSN